MAKRTRRPRRRNENGAEVAHWFFFKHKDMSDMDALATRIQQAIDDALVSSVENMSLNDLDKLQESFHG